jgi:hypothetical protein
MSTNETWYDRQATISKLLTYASILILLVSLATAATIAYNYALHELPTVAVVSTLAVGGTFIAALLIGISAIIDLMIVHAEALHDLKGR